MATRTSYYLSGGQYTLISSDFAGVVFYKDGYRWTPSTPEMAVLPVLDYVDSLLDLLRKADEFISGFEDDPSQEGVKELLEEIRRETQAR